MLVKVKMMMTVWRAFVTRLSSWQEMVGGGRAEGWWWLWMKKWGEWGH